MFAAYLAYYREHGPLGLVETRAQHDRRMAHGVIMTPVMAASYVEHIAGERQGLCAKRLAKRRKARRKLERKRGRR